jgi:hypothetical protein
LRSAGQTHSSTVTATIPPLKENDSGEQEESQALKINKAILEFVADMHIK